MATAPPEVEVVKAQNNQRAKAKRATLEALLGKKPNRDEFSVPFGPDGDRVSFLFVAIGAMEYDDLLTEHPPTAEQKVAGAAFNMNSFAPALLAKVCREPAIPAAGWTELWNSSSWGRGELMGLFVKASALCSRDIDPSPISAG